MFAKIVKIIGSIVSGAILLIIAIVGFNIIKKSFEPQKIGVECDRPSAIGLAQSILNENYQGVASDIKNGIISEFKIDPNNIVEWDYKNNRYLCKAKVSAKILSDKNINRLGYMFLGLKENKQSKTVEGWIYYQTYMPTVEIDNFKHNKISNFYIQIISEKDFPIW